MNRTVSCERGFPSGLKAGENGSLMPGARNPKSRGVRRTIRGLAPCWLLLVAAVGCSSVPRVEVVAKRYDIGVSLDPPSHGLSGRTTIDLELSDRIFDEKGMAVDVALHPGLTLQSASASGTQVTRVRRIDRGRLNASGGCDEPARYRVEVSPPVPAMSLRMEYAGTIVQDVSAGERAGAIHNFDMQAHIGPEGVYLAGGYWYPQPVGPEGTAPPLADFTLSAEKLTGLELVASGDRAADLAERTGGAAWRSPYPLDEMVLVGGPHEVHHTSHRGVKIYAHLKPSQAEHADGLLRAVRGYLDRYEPLIGSYPMDDFTIVDNFFSSGFAFPGFTLLSSAVIDLGERSQNTHGYIDHEVLHSWWGNGVHVDRTDGNWCEALASFGANYYGHVLDGDPDEARRKRRNYAHFLSRGDRERERPLGTFGLEDGCSRGIAYSKGAFVFHMLLRKVGEDAFFAALRSFDEEHLGRRANWADIERSFEDACGCDLSAFFEMWVRRAGAPEIELEAATFNTADRRLRLVFTQTGEPYEIDVPVRILHEGGASEEVITLSTERDELTLPLTVAPTAVEIDPDYHVFRRIPPDEIFPTTAATRSGKELVAVVTTEDAGGPLGTVQQVFASSFKGLGKRFLSSSGIDLSEGMLAERNVLVLGEAVRSRYVVAFLTAIDFPVKWTDSGFSISGVAYESADDAVLCTVRHPGVAGGGVTVVYGNSEEALPPPFNIPMYDNSLIVFDGGEPTVRLDFEPDTSVPVELE